MEDEKKDHKKMIKSVDTLVLSGGSIKCFMTLGSIQCLNDLFSIEQINTFVGSSAGSIISYLLIIGYTPIEIMVYVSTHNIINKMSNALDIISSLSGNGAITFNYIHELLEKMTIDKVGHLFSLKELYNKTQKKLICITYNLTKDITEILSYETYPDLPCITAIRMSSNLPLIFGHFKYLNNYYIDGGITLNLGLEDSIINSTKQVIAININDSISNFDISSPILEYIYNILSIPIRHLTKNITDKYKQNKNIIIINLQDDTFTNKIYNFNLKSNQKFDMFSVGYNITKKFFN
jgi:predicted acylesterase/phospholipase RssA